MRIGLKRILLFLSVFYLLFVFSGNAAYAHKMMIEQVEQGEIRVIFEGEEAANDVEVKLFDKDGEEIAEGTTGEDGHFSYDPELEPASIVAVDKLGHRAEWEPGESTGEGGLSSPVTIGAIVLALVLISGVFYLRTSKNKN